MLSILLNSIAIGYSGAIMPGSLLTYAIEKSLKSGAKSGLLISLGHALLELAVVSLILLGAGTVLASNLVQAIIGLVGGVFLLYLGAGMLRDVILKKLPNILDTVKNPGVSAILENSSAFAINGRMVIGGAALSASNPYFIFWWAVVGLGLILNAYNAFGIAGVAVFYTGHIFTDITWYSFVSLLISKTRSFISMKIYASVIAVLGVFLLFFGAGFLINSIKLLLALL